MRELSVKLLQQFGWVNPPESDIIKLAADLETVHYEPRLDRCGDVGVERIFLSRIGGIGALGRYMRCI